MHKISGLFLAAIFFCGTVFGQKTARVIIKDVPDNWHQLDLSKSGFNGISLDKAYDFIRAKKLKSTRVIVAVIDSGIDTLHEDLKSILWTNPKEIPGNGIDDDHNGYIDDVHGWNFIGGKDGRNVKEDSYEGARVYYALKGKWQGKDVDEATLSAADKKEYETYLEAKQKTVGDIDPSETKMLSAMLDRLSEGDSIVRKEIGKDEYTVKDLKTYMPADFNARAAKGILENISKLNNSEDITNVQLIEELSGDIRKAEAASVPPTQFRKEIVKDDETNINDRNYGNNDIMAGTPFHGTHCSGIIAAVRDNGKGVQGIADNVRIMMVRAVPDGDEHDKDIANAIRYAVDNGAKIISMSFGKDFSPQKKWVDDAFKYAESKGVLLIHAAGNDSKDIDTANNFPNPIFADGSGRAPNVITVGASGDIQNGGITASFSNYGKKEVDVFAPGVNINSTIPGGNTYGKASGTSMACPVVAGIAALVLENYPTLTPEQLKEAIVKSAVASKEEVYIPGSTEKANLSDLSVAGGIANAYEAMKYASTMKTQKKKQTQPKTTIKKSKMG
ncbi:MAG: S8 family peptidase [Ferruginibacter sp.]